LRIPIAHIEGGEVSEGAIDDAVRNALTKMSHLHFTTTERARKRVEAMGEEKWRVHRVGALSIDNLKKRTPIERSVLESLLDVKLKRPSILVAYHPVTLDRNTTSESDAVFEALHRIPSQILFSFPNADAGSRRLIRRAREFSSGLKDSRVFVNLSPLQYWSLMSHVGVVVGNSSSGIMETASLRKPTVDIGLRQRGRERAMNVLHADASASSIVDNIRRAMEPSFEASLNGLRNPYGDGDAAERIASVLSTTAIGEELLVKRAVEISQVAREDPG